MITQEQAKYFMELPKVFKNNIQALDLNDEKIRWILISPDDDEWEFLVEITNNKKKTFKISLHHQEDNSKEGLLRVDFNSGHKNPESVSSFLPDYLQRYVGYWFYNEPHIHIFIEGYKDLAWAMPLADYPDFRIKDIQSTQDYANAILEFSKNINLNSKFAIQQILK